MAYDDKYGRTTVQPHNIVMEGRKKLSISGVDDVESFDEHEIVMGTAQGVLVLMGKDLRIEKLSLDTGEVIIEGTIDKLEYESDSEDSGEGFFARLFK